MTNFFWRENMGKKRRGKETIVQCAACGARIPRDKAVVYAILKEKDSMYHYLNSFDVYQTFFLPHLNSLRAFDPYRKEERYKAFLRKNYFPITHWNE